MNWESIGTIDVMLRRPKVPEIVSWCVLISALDEAAITRIRVSLCKNTADAVKTSLSHFDTLKNPYISLPRN